MPKAVLFDLDGALLPMDQNHFTAAYVKKMAAFGEAHGFPAGQLVSALWAGTGAMVRNDGARTNREAFWETFEKTFPARAAEAERVFTAFYENEFDALVCETYGKNPAAVALVEDLSRAGVKVVVASNPMFPRNAMEMRIRWAGLDPARFDLITTYENFHYSKPNPRYYAEIADRLAVPATACLMTGNNAAEDMTAREIGMRVFLLTDHLLNEKNEDISRYPQGGFAALRAHLAAWGIPL